MSFDRVEHYFREISKIPRGTGNEKGISDYIVKFAEDHGFEYYQDDIYNVIVIKEAAPGCEDREPLILQGHIDMVCQKTLESDHDFMKDPIILVREGDILHAKDTTLGADDGIAVAYMLSVLENNELKTPRIECVFTVSEEEGMDGAIALDVTPLKGKRLLNIDSEEEGEFIAGCAGGSINHLELPIDSESHTVSDDDKFMKLTVSGLLGGHSGMEINRGRANAICKLAEILLAYKNENADLHIISLSGGGRDNVIPFYAETVFVTNEPEKLDRIASELLDEAKKEFAETDPGILYKLEAFDTSEVVADGKCSVYSADTADRFMKLMNELPKGIQKMSEDLEDVVETSLNWGVLASDNGKIKLSAGLRSMIDEKVDSLSDQIDEIASRYGFSTSVSGRYQAWQYVKHSPLREKMQEIYFDTHKEKAIVVVIHAGVECGTIAAKIPGLDAVSFGPNLYDVHTVNEHMSISSAMRIYDFLLNVIEQI